MSDLEMKISERVTPSQVRMTFVAMCIEGLAKRTGLPYGAVLEAMRQTHAVEDYIVDCYPTLHAQPYQYILDDVEQYMSRKGVRL